jgi:hypothetical protein
MEDRPYHGIVKCRVVVPSDLLHPVLPFRSKGKLLFPVCRTCAETRHDGDCGHNEEERAIEGAWTTCELYRAMDRGTIVELSEILHTNKNIPLIHRMSSGTCYRGVSLS